jgi:hypothetical protein
VTGSEELFERALRVIPGGVNSPVRAFGAVGGTPRFAVRGEGAYLVDADGRRYVDLVQSWGALLFGHARPEIVDAGKRPIRDSIFCMKPCAPFSSVSGRSKATKSSRRYPSISVSRLLWCRSRKNASTPPKSPGFLASSRKRMIDKGALERSDRRFSRSICFKK